MAEVGVVEETDEVTYFRIKYTMPKRILLTVPNWEAGVVDECVERAHKRDLMPVGEVFVSDPEDAEPDAGEVQIQLPEGLRFDTSKAGKIDVNAFMEGFLGGGPVSVDMIVVTAEVMLMGGMGSSGSQ